MSRSVSFQFPKFEHAQSAYRFVLRELLSQTAWVSPTVDSRSVGSRFGTCARKTKEIICATFAITNPRARLIDVPSRRLRIPFAFENVLWTLRGNDDVKWIAPFNPLAAQFSEDGNSFTCALGARMQNTCAGSQLEGVIKTLSEDQSSRRAIIQFYSETDSVLRPLDTPCALSMHFFVREARLTALTHMRSQSALMVLPYDIILFTMIHELIASEIRLPLGEYIHVCDSLHLYEDELSRAESVVAECEFETPTPMEKMPFRSLDKLKHVYQAEESLRIASLNSYDTILEAIDSEYWRNILRAIFPSNEQNLTNSVSKTL